MDFLNAILLSAAFGFSDPAFVGATGKTDDYAELRAAWDAAGPTLLYSAPRETSYSDGDPVTSATEFVSGTYNATQGTASAQPTYVADGIGGRPSFSFDGGDWLQASGFTFNQPNTLVAIAQFGSSGVSMCVLNGTTYTGRNVIQLSLGNWFMFAGIDITGTASDTSPHIIEASYDGSASTLIVDGSLVLSGNPGSESLVGVKLGITVGGAASFEGLLCEAAIFDTPPTSGHLDAILAAASEYYSVTLP